MKVVYEHNDEVNLENIPVGKCFRFDGQFYMRVKIPINIFTSCWIHCVNIASGEVVALAPTLRVKSVDAEIRILRS